MSSVPSETKRLVCAWVTVNFRCPINAYNTKRIISEPVLLGFPKPLFNLLKIPFSGSHLGFCWQKEDYDLLVELKLKTDSFLNIPILVRL